MRKINKSVKSIYTCDYQIGDLVMLSPADVVQTINSNDCASGPPQTTLGLAVDDGVTALILEIKETPEFWGHGEITLLVGKLQCYMNYNGPDCRPKLRILGKKEVLNADSNG